MILEYNEKFDENVKDLLCELQEYIVEIDKEKYNKMNSNFREEYFKKTLNEVKKYQGKILLYIEYNKAIGLVSGYIYNEETKSYDFECPKRGYISELIVSKSSRKKGIGSKLLKEMEHFLREDGCQKIMIGVFAYNEEALKFYKRIGYHERMTELISND